jgi:hypothetical protein
VVVEIGEWQQGADVDECGRVEEQIDNVGKDGVFGLAIKVTTAVRVNDG